MTIHANTSISIIRAALKPPHHSIQVQHLLRHAATDMPYLSACNLVVDAWLISIVDSIGYGAKILAQATIDILTCNVNQLIRRSKENTLEMMHSIKLNIALPVVLFASVFFPHIFKQFHFGTSVIARENPLTRYNDFVQENLRLQNVIYELQQQVDELQQQRALSESDSNNMLETGLQLHETRVKELTQEISRLEDDTRTMSEQLDAANKTIENFKLNAIYTKRLQQLAKIAYNGSKIQGMNFNVILNPEKDPKAEWCRVKRTFNKDEERNILLEIEEQFPLPGHS